MRLLSSLRTSRAPFRHSATHLALITALTCGLSPLSVAQQTDSAEQPTTNGVIVKLRERPQTGGLKQLQNAERAQLFSARAGDAVSVRTGPAEDLRLVRGFNLDDETLAAKLAADPDVEFAEPNRLKQLLRVPNDPLFSAKYTPSYFGLESYFSYWQWPLRNKWPAAVNAMEAWDITTGDPSIIVAVLDSGVRLEHPDLKDQLLPDGGYDFVHDDDTDGAIGRDNDPSDPGDGTSLFDPSSWHGTKVAGIIGARGNNGEGIAGISWRSKILPVRVASGKGAWDSDILAAMRWSIGLEVPGVPSNPYPARILNLSIGGRGECTSLYQNAIREINDHDAILVVAAGNDGKAVSTPANCTGVVSVGSVRFDGIKADYSDYGREVTIMAPGGDCGRNNLAPCQFQMVTTTNHGTFTPSPTNDYAETFDRNYTSPTLGTSFAAPVVSGALALIWSVNPNLSAEQVKNLMYNNATPFPTQHHALMAVPMPRYRNTPPEPTPTQCIAGSTNETACVCTSDTCGHGIVNIYNAVLAAQRIITDTSSTTSSTGTGSISTGSTPSGATSMGSTGSADTGSASTSSGSVSDPVITVPTTPSVTTTTPTPTPSTGTATTGSTTTGSTSTGSTSTGSTTTNTGSNSPGSTGSTSTGTTGSSTSSSSTGGATSSTSSSGGGGGGGGAADPFALLGLIGLAAAIRTLRRRPRVAQS